MATATRDGRMVKAGSSESAEESRQVVHDHLEALARTGAREMLMGALNEEVDAYLGRG